MPHTLELHEYGEGIGNAAAVLRNNAARAGLDAPVPSCPLWSVADLVIHQGVVHRWAAAIVEGREPRDAPSVTREAAASGDLLGWFDDGLVEVLNALGRAADDLDAWFYLADPPAPRLAWSRRMCHETTVHAIDAMTVALGRAPKVSEVWFGSRLAADGIDELLTGFLPRPRTPLRYDREVSIAVRPDDSSQSWTVSAGEEAPRTILGSHADADADAPADADLSLGGSAAGLYLALWNRGDQLTVTGDAALWDVWRARMRVG